MAQDQHPVPEPDGTRYTAPGTEDHPDLARPDESERITYPESGTAETVRAALAYGAKTERRNLVPEARITHTGEVVREWVRTALARAGAGERFYFDASLVMVPTPTGAMASAYAIVIYTPSARLDLKPFGCIEMVSDFPSKEDVTDKVRTAVAKLRDAQSAALRQPVNLRTFRPNG